MLSLLYIRNNYPCSVSDTLDDILHISKDSSKKSVKKVTPTSSKSSKTSGGGGLFDLDDGGGAGDVTGMGTDDIMKYIQQNQAADDDDLDLF